MGLNDGDPPHIELNTFRFLHSLNASTVQALLVYVKQKANEPLLNLETGAVCLARTWLIGQNTLP